MQKVLCKWLTKCICNRQRTIFSIQITKSNRERSITLFIIQCGLDIDHYFIVCAWWTIYRLRHIIALYYSFDESLCCYDSVYQNIWLAYIPYEYVLYIYEVISSMLSFIFIYDDQRINFWFYTCSKYLCVTCILGNCCRHQFVS